MTALVGADAAEAAQVLELGEVVFDGAAAEAEPGAEAGNGKFRIGPQQFQDFLGTFLGSFLGTRHGGVRGGPGQGVADGGEHEDDEWGGVAGGVGGIEGGVVTGLAVAHQGLDGKVGENGAPAGQEQRLPEAAEPAVAVGERMDVLELVVEAATGDERVVHRCLDFGEEGFDQGWHPVGGGRDMHHRLAALDADAAGAEFAGMIHQGAHQDGMGGEEVGQAAGVPLRHAFIEFQGVARLLNVLGRAKDAAAVEQGRHLFHAEGIAFDLERGLNAADPALAAQAQRAGGGLQGGQRADALANVGDQPGDLRRQGNGRKERGRRRVGHKFTRHNTPVPCSDQAADSATAAGA